MSQQPFTVMFGGQAGYGIMSAGIMLARAAGRNGLWAFVVNEYPSLIKGGTNTCRASIDNKPIETYEDGLDFLCALSQEVLDQNYEHLNTGAGILYDSDTVKPDMALVPAGVKLYPLKLIGTLTGDAKVMANSAMVGAFCSLGGFPLEAVAGIMRSEFKGEVLEKNLALLQQSFDAARQQHGVHSAFPFTAADRIVRKRCS